MGTSTSSSAAGGRGSSKPAKSRAGVAGAPSGRAKSGTSATTTKPGRSTAGQNTKPATVRQRRTPLYVGTVLEAVRRDLEQVAVSDRTLAESALAATALELARQLDAPTGCNHTDGVAGVSPTAKSMCAGQLRDTLDRLRELMPKAAEKDGLDDLSKRRSARLARRPAPKA